MNLRVYVFNLPPFNVIASILRASRTLSFKTLDDFASHTLRQMWPSDLSHLTQSQIAHASETIVLARTCKMPELLKRAFYELARTGSLGQEVVDDSIDEDITCLEDEEDKLKIISRGDLVRLIKLREELHLSWYLAADSYPSALEFSCPLVLPELPEASGQQAQPPSTPVGDVPPIIALEQNVAREKCQAAHEKFASHWDTLVKKSGIFEDCMYDPICGLDRVSKVDWSSCGFCDGCVKGWKVSWEKKREKLWSNMNLWLGLSESGM